MAVRAGLTCVLLLAATATTSACGDTSHAASSASPTVASARTRSTTSTAVSRCLLDQLSVHVVRSGGAAGSIGETYALVNRSPRTCTLYGYPGLLMLSASRRALPTHVIRGSFMTVPPSSPRLVTLAPGRVASFFLGYADVPTGNQLCARSSWLEVTPPNDYDHFTLRSSLTPCGGKIWVSPVHPGTPAP